MGRVFTEQEDHQKSLVAVLSYYTWKSRFNGDPHILGTKLLLDRKPYSVIGVMPREFEFPLNAGRLNRSELWVVRGRWLPCTLYEALTERDEIVRC
jgi:hypothetical protein